MNLPSQFLRFVLVGSCGLLLNLGITYVLTEFYGVWYFSAFLIGVVCNWMTTFLLNSLVTFPGRKSKSTSRRFFIYITVYMVSFLFNAALVYIFTSYIGVYYLFSIILATAITTSSTFILSKKIIFTYDTTAEV